MDIAELMQPLREDPRDVRGRWGHENADEIVYRLGLSATPVPGLPEKLTIDDIEVAFVEGPVLAQRTLIRQRHGLPIVFDKCMHREEIGAGELIAIFAIRTAPVPSDFDSAYAGWRARALAAAGTLTAVLDERVAGPELFEDAVLLARGRFVGGADMHGQVRSFLPYELNAADRDAVTQLADVSLDENSAVARASRLYRRAALEGPTADAYATLWIAAECFSDHGSPSRKEIEAALRAGGLDPDGLPLHVGLLIDLRAKIQHKGLGGHDRLRTAFYEMEAIVRCLIRQRSGIRSGWWLAADNAAGFADPFDHAVAKLHGRGETVWHEDVLPPVVSPDPQAIPRRVPNSTDDPRLDLGETPEPVASFLAAMVLDAIEWQDPDLELEIRVGRPDGVPADATLGSTATRVWFAEERLDGVEDPTRPDVLVNLVWEIHALVGTALAQRDGLVSRGDGAVAVAAVGAWMQYRRLVLHGEFDATAIQIPSQRDAIALGKIAGWAATGNERAIATASALDGHDRTPFVGPPRVRADGV